MLIKKYTETRCFDEKKYIFQPEYQKISVYNKFHLKLLKNHVLFHNETL